MSKGNITRRGEKSWRIKYDASRDPETGKRRTIFETVRGTRKVAEKELRKRLSAIDDGIVIEPSSLIVAAYLDGWLEDTAAHRVTPKTLERYCELVRNQIKPHLGAVVLQKLRPVDVHSGTRTSRPTARTGARSRAAPSSTRTRSSARPSPTRPRSRSCPGTSPRS